MQCSNAAMQWGDIKAFLLPVEYSSGSILAASAKVNSDKNKHHSCGLIENVTNDW
jgi:hypothetical protein